MGILLLATWLRWMEPGLVEFKYDEAHIFGMAQGIALGHHWPLLSGGTSIGVPRAALDAYLLAIPLFFAQGAPEAGVIWLGMLGVVAVALGYLLGRMIRGFGTGLLVAAYLALNPWLIYYDRKFWAHIQVLFSVLLLVLAWRVVVQNRPRARFWFPVVASLQLLTHVLALVQSLSWLGALVVAPRRWLRRETLWGTLAGLALMSPYLIALGRRALATGHHGALSHGGGVAAGRGMSSLSLWERWRQAAMLFSGDRIFELTGVGQRVTMWDTMLAWAHWLVFALMVLGVVQTLRWTRHPQRGRGARLLLAWTLGPVLALSFGPLEVYLQYWTVLLPLPAVYFSLGAMWIFERLASINRWQGYLPGPRARNSWGKQGVLALSMTVLIMVGVVWMGGWTSVLARIDAAAGSSAFGRPLKDWQEAVAQANSWAAAWGLNQVKVLAQGVDPAQDGEPAAIAALIGNPPYARFLDLSGPTPGFLLHAEQPSLYLTTVSTMDDVLVSLGEELWRGRGAHPLRLYQLPSARDAGIPIHRLPEPSAFDVR